MKEKGKEKISRKQEKEKFDEVLVWLKKKQAEKLNAWSENGLCGILSKAALSNFSANLRAS